MRGDQLRAESLVLGLLKSNLSSMRFYLFRSNFLASERFASFRAERHILGLFRLPESSLCGALQMAVDSV